MSHKGMKNNKFSPRELQFLELYFSGFLMKDAARAAGYRGSSDPALCNTGRAILTKFTGDPNFHRAWRRKRKIARLSVGLAGNSKSELQQLKALKILSRYIGG
jgi:hypothetical protein